MPITNIYQPESLIVSGLQTLFPANMIFVESGLEGLTNEIFYDIADPADKVAVLVINAGFKADPPVGNNRSPIQRLKGYWQIVVVCPSELYYTVGGVKFIEVVNHFKGLHLGDLGMMKLIDDERGFNKPDYLNDMVYLPMLFSVDEIV
jgi:hypothetical protein